MNASVSKCAPSLTFHLFIYLVLSARLSHAGSDLTYSVNTIPHPHLIWSPFELHIELSYFFSTSIINVDFMIGSCCSCFIYAKYFLNNVINNKRLNGVLFFLSVLTCFRDPANFLVDGVPRYVILHPRQCFLLSSISLWLTVVQEVRDSFEQRFRWRVLSNASMLESFCVSIVVFLWCLFPSLDHIQT